METKSNCNWLFKASIVFLLGWTLSSESLAQQANSDGLKEFKITIEQTDNGIKMQSHEGSAWIDLGFNLSNNKPQAIDEYGMTNLDHVSSHKDSQLSDYLFTITKTKNGITLKGIEGTAWKELSFPLPKNGKQSIDQFGMTE
ncbi:hypothetical protein [Algoriphagus sp. AK58]|uniref:hypothetical protein n=1 Tax=Algoriphagus sp. AK58 TaxID=1406877 RepID=UPI00165075D0|nr:hypothetical protein [Algoriphagus sp. AK58]MBC6367314.1 hypothetical protein [Algoriphagus sp. AK58]